MVVFDHYTRRIIGFGAQIGHVNGIALCQMFAKAISGLETPRYLSSDNDPLFRFRRSQANLRVLQIHEIKTVPYVPLSHPFIERLIGTLRREFLDQAFFWNAVDLERSAFKKYYNEQRTHASLGGNTPIEKAGCARSRPIAWCPKIQPTLSVHVSPVSNPQNKYYEHIVPHLKDDPVSSYSNSP